MSSILDFVVDWERPMLEEFLQDNLDYDETFMFTNMLRKDVGMFGLRLERDDLIYDSWAIHHPERIEKMLVSLYNCSICSTGSGPLCSAHHPSFREWANMDEDPIWDIKDEYEYEWEDGLPATISTKDLCEIIEELDSKASPGPWYPGCFMEDASNCKCAYIFDDIHMGAVATIHIDNGIQRVVDGANDCPPLDEARANALLISRYRTLAVVAAKKLRQAAKVNRAKSREEYKNGK